MRKRIAIILVAIVGVGVLAFVLSRPKEGSVEWHKREYLRSYNRLIGNTFIDRIEHAYYKFAKTTPAHADLRIVTGRRRLEPSKDYFHGQKDLAKLVEHKEALLRLGYTNDLRPDAVKWKQVRP